MPHFSLQSDSQDSSFFYCRLDYKGTLLNQHLMSGPDLTDQLIGILMCFRQKLAAFIADVEKMFY